jgi:hypothetical protein
MGRALRETHHLRNLQVMGFAKGSTHPTELKPIGRRNGRRTDEFAEQLYRVSIFRTSGRGSSQEAASSAYDDFADLDDRGLVGIVCDVCHDLRGMRPETSLERLDRVAEDVTHSDIRRGSAGRSTRKTLVHGIGLARIAHASFHEWHMFISVVLMVEARASRIGIHNTYLDHDVLPDLTFAG